MSDEPVVSSEPFYNMTRRAGDTLYLSGFGPVDDELNVVGADIGEQTRFTMAAIRRTLEGEGVTMAKLVRVNVFLLNMEDRDGFNAAYMEFFDGPPMPTRRLVGAGDMFKQILVEIDGIAWLGD
jgi:enamine deaminase RidA (YjgF/YER057c/UK114 family)